MCVASLSLSPILTSSFQTEIETKQDQEPELCSGISVLPQGHSGNCCFALPALADKFLFLILTNGVSYIPNWSQVCYVAMNFWSSRLYSQNAGITV